KQEEVEFSWDKSRGFIHLLRSFRWRRVPKGDVTTLAPWKDEEFAEATLGPYLAGFILDVNTIYNNWTTSRRWDGTPVQRRLKNGRFGTKPTPGRAPKLKGSEKALILGGINYILKHQLP